MRLAHLSDLHLGYGGAGHSRGRFDDVRGVFEAALGRVAELGPDLLVIAGDVFDHPDVPAPPIAAFSRGVRKLRESLPGVAIAIVAGARDTPLDPERHGPLSVVAALESVEVATTSVRRLILRKGEAAVTLVPHPVVNAARPPKLRPDSGARWNVLVIHAALASANSPALPVTPALPVLLRDWDYIALGSEHARTRVADIAHYSGSLERIGADPWGEAAVDKGFLTVDLASGSIEFWPVDARAAVSLAPVDAAGGGMATVARRLGEALAGVPGGVDGKLLRIPVRGLSARDLAVLDREILAGIRHRVAELRVDALPAGSAGK